MKKIIKELITEILQLHFLCEEEDYVDSLELRKEILFEDFNR